jgi:hypothetical protein
LLEALLAILDCPTELFKLVKLVELVTAELELLLIVAPPPVELATLTADEDGGNSPPWVAAELTDTSTLAAELARAVLEFVILAETALAIKGLGDGEVEAGAPPPPPQAANQVHDTNKKPNLKNVNDWQGCIPSLSSRTAA